MDKFKFLMSGLWVFLQPFIMLLMTKGGLLLLSAAQQAVMAVAVDMKQSSGPERQAEAFSMIKEQLKAEGIDMATEAINGAIEMAVIKLRAK